MNEIKNYDAEQALAKVILEGDLSKLSPKEQVVHYRNVCESQGLNPLTQPFEYVRFQGKVKLYAGKNCAEQLRDNHGISIKIVSRDKFDDLYVVTAEAANKNGRYDSSTGAVNLKGLTGEALANALMKCETKAKRRVTLSICGLGFLDETEVQTIPGAQLLNVNMETGEIEEPKTGRFIAQSQIASVPEDSSHVNMCDVNDYYEKLLLMKAEGNMLNVTEFWRGLDPTVKKAVWILLDPLKQKWLKGVLDAAPKEVALPVSSNQYPLHS